MAGPTYSGKTSVVANALAGRPGKFHRTILDEHDVGRSLQIALGVKPAHQSDNHMDIADQLREALQDPEVQRVMDGRPVVVCVDVRNNEHLSDTVRQVHKYLTEQQVARVVITTDNRESPLWLTPDGRHKVLWVDQFEPEEWNAFLDTRNVFPTEPPGEASEANAAMRARIAGTLPRRVPTVSDVAPWYFDPPLDARDPKFVKIVEACIQQQQKLVHADAEWALKTEPRLKPLAKALLTATTVTDAEARKLTGGLTIRDVAPVLKDFPEVLVYDFGNRVWRLDSPLAREAIAAVLTR